MNPAKPPFPKGVALPASHGFGPVIDSQSRILILGSFPSVRSREAGFFYMHPRNRFWPLMEGVFAHPVPFGNPSALSQWLRNHGIALHDVVESCRIDGSADASLRDVTFADIRSLLARAPIVKILLNGQTAARFFARGFPDLRPMAVPLPSTSPANAACGFSDLLGFWKTHLRP